MSTLVLLGAGASVDAGIPDSKKMTRKIVKSVSERASSLGSASHALNYAVGAMIAHRTARGQGAYDGIDVEDLFSAIQMLADRESLEIAPFVSWSPALASIRSSSPSASNLAREIQGAAWGSSAFGLESALREIGRDPTADSAKIFERLQREMISALLSRLTVDPARTQYLDPLLTLGDPTEIATLNYDLAIESACDRLGLACDTGIERWDGGGTWSWADGSDVRLLKLHGSADWLETSEGRLIGLREPRVSKTDLESARTYNAPPPSIVFGSRGKLRASGPFLAMLREFEMMLARAERLLIIGYSLRDEHINVAITRWLNAAPRRIVTVVDPAFGSAPTDTFAYWLRESAVAWRYETQSDERMINLRIRRQYAKDAIAAGDFWTGPYFPGPRFGTEAVEDDSPPRRRA